MTVDKSDAKQKILQAASELFLEGGLRALSVRAIAKRAGVSTIGIYSHFQGKQGILDALYIEGFARVSAVMKAAKKPNDPEKAVRKAVRDYLRVADEFEAHYQLIFGADTVDYEPSAEAQAVAAEAFGALTELAASLLPKSSNEKQKQRAALQLWALTHGFASLRRHAIARYIDPNDWEPMAVDALMKQFKALRPA